ncbi:MAG: hypothetical protein COV67_09375 [Nitrospinae bacterium CG11_big_fil_rev_8_21_14_0_20_56_8]|nr:MAG: hypothetical protein COV67_09375 [Nitrospinae bacterium CG11_big_fil_rev_8_21_14_0_20_56_8]
MNRTRKVFITVKTYPTLSKKYDELVCTAGILDDGNWVRIYPLPFRKLDYDDRYRKYQWIELPLIKNASDPRPESYRITNIEQVKLIGEPVGTEKAWAERRKIVFEKNEDYSDLNILIEKANKNELSIAIFKATELLDLVIEKTDREWSSDSLKLLNAKARQLSLFQTEAEVKKEFLIVPKLPYKFSYKFRDCNGRESTLMIEDWEIGMLYWNCLKQAGDDESKAKDLVKRKYLDEFSSKDLFLFLGTTREFHGRAKNPFVIIGVFYPPIDRQMSLL